MYTREQYLTYTAISKVAVVMISVMAAFIPVRVAQSQIGPTSSSTVEQPNAYYSHMSEELRASIKKVIVIAGEVSHHERKDGDVEEGGKWRRDRTQNAERPETVEFLASDGHPHI